MKNSQIKLEKRTAYIRTYQAYERKSFKKHQEPIPPSKYSLTFDTETTTDPAQNLTIGTYQARKEDLICDEGIFYNPEIITSKELDLLLEYAAKKNLELLTVYQFISKVFYAYGYRLEGIIIGFNLPFDLSRLAYKHSRAKTRSMRGGFTLELSPDSSFPNVQIKHLSRRAAMMRFASIGKQHTPKNMLANGEYVFAHQGYFLDVKTIAAALTSRSWNLANLCDHLKIQNKSILMTGTVCR